MLVSLDFEAPVEVLHSVKVIIGDGDELHVTVSADGVIYDRISGGEAVRTQCVFADDILPEADTLDATCRTCGVYLDGNTPDEVPVGDHCAHCAGETLPACDVEDSDDAVLAIVENAPDWSAEKVLAVKKFADAFGKRSNV